MKLRLITLLTCLIYLSVCRLKRRTKGDCDKTIQITEGVKLKLNLGNNL
jgi:hypothetical protein